MLGRKTFQPTSILETIVLGCWPTNEALGVATDTAVRHWTVEGDNYSFVLNDNLHYLTLKFSDTNQINLVSCRPLLTFCRDHTIGKSGMTSFLRLLL